ncbi:Cupredoxin [Cryphonectria parasitica EP155]|uniref:Cupredoxin n=1 Tax=Cryphonectria parasitica (strain ATCC 38755 / EP155) TaxID=660469 RepID=A0A9P4Y503_CRYP1|nr:Cupredoxin [Cryphonectria parasitica EP155]KAF3766574.1 Cupredoxin [Cryphonectria parasitica EP155]
MQFTTAALALMAGFASAQKIQVVTVGSSNGSLTYSPDSVQAAVGDMVQFQFVAANHTVTQSTFDQPCQPISLFSTNVTGFHSGFMPVAAGGSNIPTYTIQVNNTTPIWVYCAQARHCESGMVMVINENTAANASRSLANFKSLASGATTVTPGTAAADTSSSSSSTTSGTTTTTSSAGMVKVGGTTLGLAGLAAAIMLL